MLSGCCVSMFLSFQNGLKIQEIIFSLSLKSEVGQVQVSSSLLKLQVLGICSASLSWLAFVLKLAQDKSLWPEYGCSIS